MQAWTSGCSCVAAYGVTSQMRQEDWLGPARPSIDDKFIIELLLIYMGRTFFITFNLVTNKIISYLEKSQKIYK